MHDRGAGICVENRDLLREVLREDEIVAVEERDELALRRAQRRVACRRGPPIRRSDDLYPPVSCSETTRDCQRVVGRSVVDENELEVGKGLREDGIHRFGEVPRSVVRRRHHADDRRAACRGRGLLHVDRLSKGNATVLREQKIAELKVRVSVRLGVFRVDVVPAFIGNGRFDEPRANRGKSPQDIVCAAPLAVRVLAEGARRALREDGTLLLREGIEVGPNAVRQAVPQARHGPAQATKRAKSNFMVQHRRCFRVRALVHEFEAAISDGLQVLDDAADVCHLARHVCWTSRRLERIEADTVVSFDVDLQVIRDAVHL